MAQRNSFAEAVLDVEPGARRASLEIDDERPFRLALIGDFSGRGGGLAAARSAPIDRDEFHAAFERLAPSAATAAGVLEFHDLDDFHPDALWRDAEVFRRLRELRKRLNDPARFAEAAAEMAPLAASEPPSAPPAAPASGADVLSAMLGEGESAPPVRPASPPAGDREWRELIRRIVAPHAIPRADPRRDELVAQVDRAMADQMRAILRDPAFRSIESCWRALFLLLDRLDSAADIRIEIVDATASELLADLDPGRPVEESGLYRLLAGRAARTPGAVPWSAAAALHVFEPDAVGLAALGRLAEIAALAGAPAVAGAAAAFLGPASFAQAPEARAWSFRIGDAEAEAAWSRLRQRPEAAWLGLALPRFLARPSYGDDGWSTEAPGFEELDRAGGFSPDALPWIPAAAACAYLLGAAYARAGWAMRPGMVRLLDRLPIWRVGQGADRETLPCTEVWLADDDAERILDRGLMPLVSFKGRDAAAIARFQSVADPPRPLAGPWDEA